MTRFNLEKQQRCPLVTAGGLVIRAARVPERFVFPAGRRVVLGGAR